MRKKILYALMCAATIATINPVTAYADTTEDTQAQVTQEVDQALLDASMEPIPEENKKEIVESAFTSYSDETSSMICVTAIVPENFGLNAYAQVRNMDSGTVYNLPMYAANGYFERCYVPSGNYSFTIVAAYGDSTNTYSFDFPRNQFFVEPKQSAEFEIVLNGYDEIEAKLEEKYTDTLEQETEDESKPNKNENHVKSDFEVTYTGSGLAEVGVTGKPDDEYDITVKIVEGGRFGESSFVYSLDDGATWSETLPISLAGIYELEYSGLTIEFFLPDETASFIANDVYECYVQSPDVNIVIEQTENSYADVVVISNTEGLRDFEALEKIGTIMLKVVKEGNIGDAVYELSLDDGLTWSEQDFITEEIVVTSSTDPELSVILKFTTESVGHTAFERNDIYTIYTEREVNNAGAKAGIILLTLIGIIAVAAVLVYMKLKKAIPGADEYSIRK